VYEYILNSQFILRYESKANTGCHKSKRTLLACVLGVRLEAIDCHFKMMLRFSFFLFLILPTDVAAYDDSDFDWYIFCTFISLIIACQILLCIADMVSWIRAPGCMKRFDDALKEARRAVERSAVVSSQGNNNNNNDNNDNNDHNNDDDYYNMETTGGDTGITKPQEEVVRPRSGWYDVQYELNGRRHASQLNIRFVTGSGTCPKLYAMFGEGIRNKEETVIIEGLCNDEGLAWWTERVAVEYKYLTSLVSDVFLTLTGIGIRLQSNLV
jgi:hypothetical protein